MQHSHERILTTHTGSLPRPAALVQMYAQRANGQTVDEALLERAGHQAMQASSKIKWQTVSISVITRATREVSFCMSNVGCLDFGSWKAGRVVT